MPYWLREAVKQENGRKKTCQRQVDISVKNTGQNDRILLRMADGLAIMKKKGKEEYQIVLNKKIDILKDIDVISGKKFQYLLVENTLYRCDKNYENTTFKLLKILKDNFMTELTFGKEQLPELFSVILFFIISFVLSLTLNVALTAVLYKNWVDTQLHK